MLQAKERGQAPLLFTHFITCSGQEISDTVIVLALSCLEKDGDLVSFVLGEVFVHSRQL
jgi:hypothetical protein